MFYCYFISFVFVSLGDLIEPKKIKVPNKTGTVLKPGFHILEKATSQCRKIELKDTQIHRHTNAHNTHTYTQLRQAVMSTTYSFI